MAMNFRPDAGKFLTATVLILLACAHARAASGQVAAPGMQHSKVPAVARAVHSVPEPAPAPDVSPSQNRGQNRRRPVRAAAHMQPMQGQVFMDGPPEVETFDYAPPGAGLGAGPADDCRGHCRDIGCDTTCGPDPCQTAFENVQLFGGIAAFKSPVDQGLNGNFGFHEGANWSGPLFEYGGIGAQIGFRAVQSDLAESYAFEDNRVQTFFTTGLFHRPMNGTGLQGGGVWDWLHDEFYGTMNVAQLRGEVSWLCCDGHEFGAWAAVATTSDTGHSPSISGRFAWEPLDLYALFYRRNLANGGYGRFSAGATGGGQGLLGFDIFAPVSHKVAIVIAANYVIGRNDPRPEESLTEAWGMTIGFVWSPFYKNCNSPCNPYRPVFGVADNTSMILGYNGPRIN
jgi:hypothetical protein